MTDIHVKTLATYQNLGSIYSYGYGALRQAYQSFHDGLDTLDYYIKATQRIISAVEFRTAEVQASHLLGMDRLQRDCGQQPYQPVQAETSAVYQAPAGADGIARDQ